MPIRIATYNLENLFSRPRVMRLDSWAAGRPALDDISELNDLLEHVVYTDEDKSRIAELLNKYGATNNLFRVNQVRGKLYVTRRATGLMEVTAKGRLDWTGWIELIRDDTRWEATVNTARVIDAVRPDIMLAVEVEDRLTLQRFNDQVLGEDFPAARFPYNVVLDGNDPRGIDLGLLSRFPIRSVRSHIFDTDDEPDAIFSRDCPEYEIALPDGSSLWILGNHLKSKGYGSWAATTRKRLRQARRVREIYTEALTRSDHVIVAGDLNDTPDSEPLVELTRDTALTEAMTHPTYRGRPGTYGTGNSANQKIDYLLMSPALWSSVTNVDVERRGVYAPRAGNPWPSVTSKATQASDHAMLWADLDL